MAIQNALGMLTSSTGLLAIGIAMKTKYIKGASGAEGPAR